MRGIQLFAQFSAELVSGTARHEQKLMLNVPLSTSALNFCQLNRNLHKYLNASWLEGGGK
jgi:hypothetical protein